MKRDEPTSAGDAAEVERVQLLLRQQEAHESAGGHSATGPLFQQAARETIAADEARFRDGDERAVVHAMNECALHGLPMPEWLAVEWLRRSRQVTQHRKASWDEVLPRFTPEGRKLSALRMARVWGLSVVLAVRQARADGRAVDDGLFELLAKERRWPFSGAQAKKLYYGTRKDRRYAFLEHPTR